MNGRLLLGGSGLAVVAGMVATVVYAIQTGEAPDALWKGHAAECGPRYTLEAANESLELGAQYMLRSQNPDGTFVYEYDWLEHAASRGNNTVRQAGATWGLALLQLHDPSPKTQEGALAALAYWSVHSKVVDGRRLVLWEGSTRGESGALALVTLAHIDLIRSGLSPADEAWVYEHLEGYLAQLLFLEEEGEVPARYASNDGKGYGASNPYANGEALLAVVKAAKLMNRSELLERAKSMARKQYELHVRVPREDNPDPDKTKGYYQWGSMAWWELQDAGVPGDWGEWVMELAVWMIEDHRTLQRPRNTGYAYEGIANAYEIAKRTGDERADQFACVLDQGLNKLTSWQVGHSLSNDFVSQADDPVAVGGVQNHAEEAGLRIDTTQHQMHAVALTKQHFLVGRE